MSRPQGIPDGRTDGRDGRTDGHERMQGNTDQEPQGVAWMDRRMDGCARRPRKTSQEPQGIARTVLDQRRKDARTGAPTGRREGRTDRADRQEAGRHVRIQRKLPRLTDGRTEGWLPLGGRLQPMLHAARNCTGSAGYITQAVSLESALKTTVPCKASAASMR